MKNRTYIAIDLKSFYASVECIERGLDPLTTNLVVADASRTEKTICLAVSPSLKAYGIPGRARLFEVVQKVKEINAARQRMAPEQVFSGASFSDTELKASSGLSLDYIVAPPQMAHYMSCSTRIYTVYLKYVAPEDIHVYSIDEVFIDTTDYLNTYKLSARDFATKMIQDVLDTTGVTATAGIGTNLYLAKVAMDIEAKHIPADKNGMRIAELDEISYRRSLWAHRPLTDFWRVGRGYAQKLEKLGLFTMGDIARCSLGNPADHYNEDLLYKLFGINAELLIDHAWGWEPCTIADIKAYKPSTSSIGSGQVLQHPYSFAKARLIVREMADLLALDLVDKRLVTDQLALTVGYDIENLTDPKIKKLYHGAIMTDRYGRDVPKSAHGTTNLGRRTASTMLIMNAITELFECIVDKNLMVRRVYLTANHVVDEGTVQKKDSFEQLDLFTDYAAAQEKKEAERVKLVREKKMQKAMLEIKKKHGKNAILRGMNLEEGATTVDRNKQIGGHKA
ncbi:MAG: DNA methylase [Spirochaetia bacterium]|nr:DNA methylase [Spirochaetia bacterium]